MSRRLQLRTLLSYHFVVFCFQKAKHMALGDFICNNNCCGQHLKQIPIFSFRNPFIFINNHILLQKKWCKILQLNINLCLRLYFIHSSLSLTNKTYRSNELMAKDLLMHTHMWSWFTWCFPDILSNYWTLQFVPLSLFFC